MEKKIEKHASRLLVMALRHDPAVLGLEQDSAGYCLKNDARKALREQGYKLSEEDLEIILQNERFGVDPTGQKMRVDYGNSIGLKLEDMYESSQVPPEILYHGTSADALDSIKKSGILRFAKNGKKPRDHVFMTESPAVAMKKGTRYGRGVALPVLAWKMHEDGFLFYHAKNDIWLTDHVPPEYLDLENMKF